MKENDVMPEDVQDDMTAKDGQTDAPDGCWNDAADDMPPIDEPDVDRLVDEAERRGYLRGRNEAIAETMKKPGVWGGPFATPTDANDVKSRPVVLSNVRRSVWDI